MCTTLVQRCKAVQYLVKRSRDCAIARSACVPRGPGVLLAAGIRAARTCSWRGGRRRTRPCRARVRVKPYYENLGSLGILADVAAIALCGVCGVRSAP
eukprot:7036743-Prymnesium_polylepis.2